LAVKIMVGLVALIMGASAFNWLIDPGGAAQSLGMPLLDGLGRSTQIGDFSAFFVGVTLFCLLGIIRGQNQWLYAAAIILGLAAIMRTLAWLVHGAPFAPLPIGVEVVSTILLLVSARLLARAES
jgi:hypothetical protein